MSHILDLAQAAIKFAQAAADTKLHRTRLNSAYLDWREATGHSDTRIERNDANWILMMQATADQYQHLRNAKSRERHAKVKLLALVDALDIAE